MKYLHFKSDAAENAARPLDKFTKAYLVKFDRKPFEAIEYGHLEDLLDDFICDSQDQEEVQKQAILVKELRAYLAR